MKLLSNNEFGGDTNDNNVSGNEPILSEEFSDKQQKLDNINSDEYSKILDQDNEELDDTTSDEDEE